MIDTGSSDLWLDICTGGASAPRTLAGIPPANVSGDNNITISYMSVCSRAAVPSCLVVFIGSS